jgi:hypothetical protein
MNAKIDTKVCSANSLLEAINIQTFFERAGIPAMIMNSKDAEFINVYVPGSLVNDCIELLHPEVRTGEIFRMPK